MDEGRQSPAIRARARPIAARLRQWLRCLWPDPADRARSRLAHAIYHEVVNRARIAVFYRDLGVPDTPEGRFEMVGLHVALLVRRLRREGPLGRALGQELFDLMFADIDEGLRHIGIGDVAVGKQIRRLAGNFYARLKALDEAFATEPGRPLRAMLRTNVYHGGVPPSERQLEGLVRYLIEADRALRAQPGASLLAGRLSFRPAASARRRCSGVEQPSVVISQTRPERAEGPAGDGRETD